MRDARRRSASPAGRLLAAVLMTVAASGRVVPARAAAATPQEIDQGRDLYSQLCATCHGRDMVNTGGFAFDLRTYPKDAFERFRGSVANGKGQGMPAWREQLSDEDIALLWDYVASGGRD